jgi:hypothetical protein
MVNGNLWAFTKQGVCIDDGNKETRYPMDALPIALAVAASSAFPPLFPPVSMSHKTLHRYVGEFPIEDYLTDGGVFDNLGTRKLYRLQRTEAEALDFVVVSDAQAKTDWKLGKRYSFLPSRATRASDLLMKRVSDLEYHAIKQGFPDPNTKVIRCTLQDSDPAKMSGYVSGLPDSLLLDSRKIRTDLDAFSPLEAEVLVRVGYAMAWRALKAELVDSQPATKSGADASKLKEPPVSLDHVSGRPWTPTPPANLLASINTGIATLDGSGRQKPDLWSKRDPVSWMIACWCLLMLLAAASPLVYMQYRVLQTVEEKTTITQEKLALEFDVARRRSRLRPIQPGISVSGGEQTAGTICCVVQDRLGGGKRYILCSNLSFYDWVAPGHTCVQPGVFDGGILPEIPPNPDRRDDRVAVVRRTVRFNLDGPNHAVGVLAEPLPEVQVLTEVFGFGRIKGIGPVPKKGDRVVKVGRTSGITEGEVIGILNSGFHFGEKKQWVQLNDLVGVKFPSPFSTGDTGAPVLTQDGKLIGMVWSGSHINDLVVPIHNIFDALSVDLVP